MIYNPYRNYEKGMDDAYMGIEQQSYGKDYLEGYERALQLEIEEERTKQEEQHCLTNLLP